MVTLSFRNENDHRHFSFGNGKISRLFSPVTGEAGVDALRAARVRIAVEERETRVGKLLTLGALHRQLRREVI